MDTSVELVLVLEMPIRVSSTSMIRVITTIDPFSLANGLVRMSAPFSGFPLKCCP
jgi:hypothetical protein